MHRNKLSGQRLVMAFMAGCLLFNYPILSIFDRPGLLFGSPQVFVYLFAVWLALIALMAWVVDRPDRGGN